MKTEIILCDFCKECVAKGKCGICQKDLCNFTPCVKNIYVLARLPFKVCTGCCDNLHNHNYINSRNQLGDRVLADYPKLEKVKEELLNYIRTKFFAERLK